MPRLLSDFYTRPDVVQISRELLGKVIYTNISDTITSGIITETEAYAGTTDKASHAYGNKRTKRTEIMYATGGTAYVYLCYGIHHLFNVVTNIEGIPHAVLIRAIEPLSGIEKMLERRNKNKVDKSFSSGPGTTSQALAIKTSHSGLNLLENAIWIEDHGIKIPDNKVMVTKRIGIDYAEEDANLPYRFVVAS